MAINMNDKEGLFKQILSEADINVTSGGILLTSGQRLATPKFVPFEDTGKCRKCKATECDVDGIICKEGIALWCPRFKNSKEFVPFDVVYDLPGHCFFRIKNKARVFNLPHGDQPLCRSASTQTLSSASDKETKEELEKIVQLAKEATTTEEVNEKGKLMLELLEANLMADALQEGEFRNKAKTVVKLLISMLFADSMQTKTTITAVYDGKKLEDAMDIVSDTTEKVEGTKVMGKDAHTESPTHALHTIQEGAEDEALQEFYHNISAATTFLDHSQQESIPLPASPPKI